jgi:hypothetical protein
VPQIITPPIRTALLTQNGVPFGAENGDIQTTRDWWLYWNRLGDAANLTGLQTSEGAHGDRPVPDGMPDGAIYVESDRGAIYQVQGGDWIYVAGIMYGTISPDQRPTDLGPNDAGFAFTATDPLASDTGRTFAWSGTAWVETSQVLYGTHANRPATAAAPARCLYVEADRGPMFQNQLGQWVYLAGTMWGTLSPDQRPTDLGMFDAGFDFRTNVAPAREFIWSGTAWVETTPISGAMGLTHANVVTKVGAAGQIVEGGITDESAANSDTLHITAAGDVGVGIVPATALHVSRGFGNTVMRIECVAGSAPFLDFKRASYDFWVGSGIDGLNSWSVYDVNAGAWRLLITQTGGISLPGLPSINPGAGTKQLWFDPSDGNRVKFAP